MNMSAQRVLLASLSMLVLITINACTHDSAPVLSAPEAHARAQAGTLTLIDVRHADEWQQTGVAKGALRIDMTNTRGETGFVQQVTAEMHGNKNAPIGLLSLSSNRATNAQQVLLKAGFTQVYVIREGMMGSRAGPGWIARGLPLQP
jgi:rhodanese-related sulfurtransferase